MTCADAPILGPAPCSGAALRAEDVPGLDFAKCGGLLPAIVQDATCGDVLMLGYMNAEALRRTLSSGRVTFWSRSRGELWEKGATSGHALILVEVRCDCDRDALLVLARPSGPACHRGTRSCFADAPLTSAARLAFLARLETIIAARIGQGGAASYTARLHASGTQRMAQKLAEEGVEVALAAVADSGRAALRGECADLLFHLLVLLHDRDLDLAGVVEELEQRHAARQG